MNTGMQKSVPESNQVMLQGSVPPCGQPPGFCSGGLWWGRRMELCCLAAHVFPPLGTHRACAVQETEPVRPPTDGGGEQAPLHIPDKELPVSSCSRMTIIVLLGCVDIPSSPPLGGTRDVALFDPPDSEVTSLSQLTQLRATPRVLFESGFISLWGVNNSEI